MILHREIGGFSAGQKSKLTLGAAFWTHSAVQYDITYIYMSIHIYTCIEIGL